MTKFIVGAVAIAGMTAIAFVQPAEARCFWNGSSMVCPHDHGHVYYHHYARPTKLVLFAHRQRAHPGREHEIGQGSSTRPGAAGPHAPAPAQTRQTSDGHQPGQQDQTKEEH